MERKNAVYTIAEERSAEEARREHVLLVARNLAAGAAAALFLASFALADIHKLLRAIAYFCGAGAYVAEILILTDGFRRKVPQKELFMAYCFGPLYILLGLELSARSIKKRRSTQLLRYFFSCASSARQPDSMSRQAASKSSVYHGSATSCVCPV